MRGRALGAAVATALCLGLTACSSGGSTGASTGEAGFVAGDGTLKLLAGDERQSPVSLTGETLDGARLDLASLRGKPVVLNVWGSWCGPCRKEAPDLIAAAKELGSSASFVGINTRDADQAQAKAFERSYGVTYPSFFDPGGTLLLSLRGAVAPNAIPTTLVLDGQGRIAARITGATTKATLVGVVQDVAKAGS